MCYLARPRGEQANMVADLGTVRKDRRRAERTPAVLAVALDTTDKPGRHGVTRDLSEKGLLVVTPSTFKPGDRVTVTVHAAGEGVNVSGEVRRVDENPISSPELWRWRVGIELDAPLPNEFVERGLRMSRRFKTYV
jgi:hypothetical protein